MRTLGKMGGKRSNLVPSPGGRRGKHSSGRPFLPLPQVKDGKVRTYGMGGNASPLDLAKEIAAKL